MKKIVVASNSTWNLYNFRFDLINELAKKNKVYILAPRDKYIDKFSNVIFINFNFDIKSMSILKNLEYFFFYIKKLQNIKPDFFLSFTTKPNIIGSLACIYLKINFIPNITGLGTLFLRSFFLFHFSKIIFNFIFRYASKIYFHNIEDKNFFCHNNLYLKKKSIVIPGSGVNLKKFPFKKTEKKSFFTFLYFGRIIKDKGLNELLEAIYFIKKKEFKLTFIFVGKIGEKSLKKKIQKLIKLNHIKYYKFTDSIKKYIYRSGCVILPSYREGLPKSILEAQSMGRPAIVSDVEGCRSIIKNNYNGFLFAPRSSESIIECIKKFIKLSTKERIKMSLNSHINTKKKFNNGIITQQYLKDIG